VAAQDPKTDTQDKDALEVNLTVLSFLVCTYTSFKVFYANNTHYLNINKHVKLNIMVLRAITNNKPNTDLSKDNLIDLIHSPKLASCEGGLNIQRGRGVRDAHSNQTIHIKINVSVMEPTRREASGSRCKLLLVNMVKTHAGSNNSKWVWYGQNTKVMQGQVWIFIRQTIARGLDKRGCLIM